MRCTACVLKKTSVNNTAKPSMMTLCSKQCHEAYVLRRSSISISLRKDLYCVGLALNSTHKRPLTFFDKLVSSRRSNFVADYYVQIFIELYIMPDFPKITTE